MFIFDDPLSALDINVGEHVFKKGLVKYLKGKTRIMVTHNINIMSSFDKIIMMEDGKIIK